MNSRREGEELGSGKEGTRGRKRVEQERLSLLFFILLVSFWSIVPALPSSTAYCRQPTPPHLNEPPCAHSYNPSLGTTFTDPRSHSPFHYITHHITSHIITHYRIGGPAGSMKGGRQIEASKEILSEKNVPYIVAAPLLIQGD